jgi:hypothetical protein
LGRKDTKRKGVFNPFTMHARTYVHARTQEHAHTHTRTHVPARTHVSARTHVRTYIHTYARTHTITHTHKYATHTRTYVHNCTHTHVRARTHTCARTHTYARAYQCTAAQRAYGARIGRIGETVELIISFFPFCRPLLVDRAFFTSLMLIAPLSSHEPLGTVAQSCPAIKSPIAPDTSTIAMPCLCIPLHRSVLRVRCMQTCCIYI